jgi:hypothetical protein
MEPLREALEIDGRTYVRNDHPDTPSPINIDGQRYAPLPGITDSLPENGVKAFDVFIKVKSSPFKYLAAAIVITACLPLSLAIILFAARNSLSGLFFGGLLFLYFAYSMGILWKKWPQVRRLSNAPLLLTAYKNGIWFCHERKFIPYERFISLNIEKNTTLAPKLGMVKSYEFIFHFYPGSQNATAGNIVLQGLRYSLNIDYEDIIRRLQPLIKAQNAKSGLPMPLFFIDE